MSDEPKSDPPVPAKPRKYRRRKRASPASPPRESKTSPAELAGMNATACCDSCSPSTGCFISCGNSCVHPNKGGLQAAHLANHEVVKRFGRAKKYLAQAKLDKVYA